MSLILEKQRFIICCSSGKNLTGFQNLSGLGPKYLSKPHHTNGGQLQ